LWIGSTNEGLFYVNQPKSDQSVFKHYPITQNRIMSIVWYEPEGLICATENDGLIIIKSKDAQPQIVRSDAMNRTNLESNSIWSLAIDSHERLWLGYYNKGVGLFDPDYSKFGKITSGRGVDPHALSSSSVDGFAEDDQGNIYIGMDGGGVNRYNPDNQEISRLNQQNSYSGLVNQSVQAVFMDSQNTLWIGVWGDGFYKLRSDSRVFEDFSSTRPSQSKPDRVVNFAEDVEGNIWLATFGGGVQYVRQTDNTLKRFDQFEKSYPILTDGDIRDIVIDDQGSVWVGSTAGLFKLNLSETDTTVTTFQNHPQASGFPPEFNYVLSLYYANENIVWMGTDGAGLFRYDVGKDYFEHIELQEGLGLQTISAITQDHIGNFWATTKAGVLKISGDGEAAVHYTKEDGLLSNDFNYGAAFTSSSGTVYLGNEQGVSTVPSQGFEANQKEVSVYFQNLRL